MAPVLASNTGTPTRRPYRRIGPNGRSQSGVLLTMLCAALLGCSTREDRSATQGTTSARSVSGASVAASAKTPPSVDATEPKRYEVESGVVEYRYDGVQSGTETLSFSAYGRFERRERVLHLQLGGGLGDQHIVTLIHGDTLTVYNAKTKKGTAIERIWESYGGKATLAWIGLPALGLELARRMGGIESGTKTVAGLSCHVWKIEKLHTTLCLHKGISLETTVDAQGKTQHTVATKVNLAARVAAGQFEVPSDVKIDERPAVRTTVEQNDDADSAGLTPDEVRKVAKKLAAERRQP